MLGCFLATLLFSKGSSCLVLKDFWSRDILAVLASAAGGVQVLLGCSFTAQLGSVSMQPQRARQPLFDAWSRLEAPDAANDGVQLLLRPALRAKAVPELGLSRATRYMSAVPLAAKRFAYARSLSRTGYGRRRRPVARFVKGMTHILNKLCIS